jgi:hypothetical protein
MFCIVFSVLCCAGHCIKTWLAKGKVDLREEADSCQVRSNALGAFERTHGRTQAQPALTVICVRTQGSAVERTPSQP